MLLFVVLGVIASLPPSEDSAKRIEYGTILTIAPKGVIKEKEDEWQWLNGLLLDRGESVTLFELTKSIREAAIDEKVEALYLDFSYIKGISSAHLIEIKDALLAFKMSKKPIWAYSTYYNTSDYYLASFADVIGLDPMGEVSIKGFSSESLYFKGMEEKFGINFQTFHAGECKGAVESFSRANMSDEVRKNVGSAFFSMWDFYLQDVCKNTEKTQDEIILFANEPYEMLAKYAGNEAEMAQGESIVTHLCTKDDFESKMKDELSSSNDDLAFVSYVDYAKNLKVREDEQKVGIIYLTGSITAKKPTNKNADVAVAGDIASLFEKAISDPSIKAIVLRVDSGGGEVFASEVIRRSVQKAKDKGKPVVVSMASVAASGAYWISSSASYIFASPLTVTGSIGVLAVLPNFHTFLREKLGITTDSVGVLSNTTSSFEPLSAEDAKKMDLSIDATYNSFLSTVATGRGMKKEDVSPIAEGKIYSGLQARELGLVDEIGTFSASIEKAASLANLSSFSTVELREPETKMAQFMNAVLDMHVSEGEFYMLKVARELLSLQSKNGIYLYTPTRLMWQK